MEPGKRVLVREQWPATVIGDNYDGRTFVSLDSGCSAAYPETDLTPLVETDAAGDHVHAARS